MNRRNFVQAAASLFPAAGWLKQLGKTKTNLQISRAAPPHSGYGALDVRGIMAMYDLPDARPKSIWHNDQDYFMFDARKDRRYDGDFWDRSRWDHYLTLWSSEGYNAVFWYGPNELMTGDQVLVRFKEFPEAREIPDDLSEKIIGQVKWLFRRAKELGMRNFLYGDFVHYTRAFEVAHGLDKPISPWCKS
jgi:hypothetical protein